MPTFVVLLRGVNVGGNNKVPMADLRAAAEAQGYANVRTYVNSGNLVLDGKGTPAAVAKDIEALLARRFKVEVPVVARTAAQWTAYLDNPFPDGRPAFVQLGLSKAPPAKDCAAAIKARAAAGEQVQVVGDGVWITSRRALAGAS